MVKALALMARLLGTVARISSIVTKLLATGARLLTTVARLSVIATRLLIGLKLLPSFSKLLQMGALCDKVSGKAGLPLGQFAFEKWF